MNNIKAILRGINKKIEETINCDNEKEESTLLTSRERYMIPRLSIETLKKAANIKDYRYKYY